VGLHFVCESGCKSSGSSLILVPVWSCDPVADRHPILQGFSFSSEECQLVLSKAV